ncbi:hypothetical protein MIR68_006212 [Amoeboaphelidium protococcarum]|nr:hypothetical protein MIR68_006212 [Amoeboaphelidium protococcarum]
MAESGNDQILVENTQEQELRPLQIKRPRQFQRAQGVMRTLSGSVVMVPVWSSSQSRQLAESDHYHYQRPVIKKSKSAAISALQSESVQSEQQPRLAGGDGNGDDEIAHTEQKTPRKKSNNVNMEDDNNHTKTKDTDESAKDLGTKQRHSERTVPCTVEDCKKMFKDEPSMKKHYSLAHDKSRQYTCKTDGCNQLFNTRRELTDHKLLIHSDKNT